VAAKAAMMMMGCPPGCHVSKDCSGGILFQDHSQGSPFVASSGTSVGHSTGTGSLVGERLIHQQKNHLAPHLSPLTLCAGRSRRL